MNKSKNEEIKESSNGLSGNLAQELLSESPFFSEESTQLLKFHGSYQQDDRDQRIPRRKAGLEKAWQFMLRSKIPGGDLNANQFLVHCDLTQKLASGTLRLTNRQGIQLHGILKGSLKQCIQKINVCGLTTRGACGDIVRNTTACAIPFANHIHQEVQALAARISRNFYSQSPAYSHIWLDGEELNPEQPSTPESQEPLYLKAYLPRKFKIGITIPPHNDVDVFSNDLALVAIVENDHISGYNVYVGGGSGMSHGQSQTNPALAQPLLYTPSSDIIRTLETIISVQRDFGRRDDRKQARLKYLIRDRGIEWFAQQTAQRLGSEIIPIRPVNLDSVEDHLGWHEQGDGRWFYGIWIPDGRISNTENASYFDALQSICQQYSPNLRITSNANIYLYNLEPSDRPAIDQILLQNKIPNPTQLSQARQMSHACVAHPTCGLALAESERVFQSIMDQIDQILINLNLWSEPLLFRISGCPNGCARPYNADFAFVGRAPGKYALYVGGSHRGDRLAGLEHKSMKVDQLLAEITSILSQFVSERTENEAFGDFWVRVNHLSEAPTSEHFHLERSQRSAAADLIASV